MEDFWQDDPADYPALQCHRCSGTGEVVGDDDIEHACPECGGDGWMDGIENNYDANDGTEGSG